MVKISQKLMGKFSKGVHTYVPKINFLNPNDQPKGRWCSTVGWPCRLYSMMGQCHWLDSLPG